MARPKAAAKKTAAPGAAAPAAPPPQPEGPPDLSHLPIVERITLLIDAIAAAWADGMTYGEIGRTLNPQLSAAQVAGAIRGDDGLRERMRLARELRAELLMDRAVREAKLSQPKDAAALNIKLAAKYDPQRWSDRQVLEHTGAGGGPIKSEVTMTPDEAYRRMLNAKE